MIPPSDILRRVAKTTRKRNLFRAIALAQKGGKRMSNRLPGKRYRKNKEEA